MGKKKKTENHLAIIVLFPKLKWENAATSLGIRLEVIIMECMKKIGVLTKKRKLNLIRDGHAFFHNYAIQSYIYTKNIILIQSHGFINK